MKERNERLLRDMRRTTALVLLKNQKNVIESIRGLNELAQSDEPEAEKARSLLNQMIVMSVY